MQFFMNLTVDLKPEGEYRKKKFQRVVLKHFSFSLWPIETDFLGIPYNKADKYINIAILQFTKVNASITHVRKLGMYQRWY